MDVRSETAWADETGYLVGHDSIDLFDLYLKEPGMQTLVETFLSANPAEYDDETSEKHSIVEASRLLGMSTLRDLEAVHLSQAGASKLYVARPYTAAPYYSSLGTP
jgi:hypothetical protein